MLFLGTEQNLIKYYRDLLWQNGPSIEFCNTITSLATAEKKISGIY